jgi:hypothetical protein
MVLLHKSNRLVLQVFEEDGTLSLRSVAKYLIQISKSRILKDNLRCACHYMYECPNFLPEDLPLRLQLCQWLQQQHEANQNFIKIILFNACPREKRPLTIIIIMCGQNKIPMKFMLML